MIEFSVIQFLKRCVVGYFVIIGLDLLFFTVLQSFVFDQLRNHVHIVDNTIKIQWGYAIAVWALLIGGILIFVVPKSAQLFPTFLYGALFGFMVYGIYEGVNSAIIQNWPLLFALVDVAWGTILTGIVSVIIVLI